MGSAGDSPAPVGGSPAGTAESRHAKDPILIGSDCSSHSARRVAGRHRRVACATRKGFSKHALSEFVPIREIHVQVLPFTVRWIWDARSLIRLDLCR